jgi:hypothetical protein
MNGLKSMDGMHGTYKCGAATHIGAMQYAEPRNNN